MPDPLSVNKNMNLVTNLLTYKNQLQILHWQTVGYAEHVAIGGLYDALDGLIDAFIETFMGKYGRVLGKGGFVLALKNYQDYPPTLLLEDVTKFLSEDVPVMLSEKDTDLLNIRDEMLGAVNKTKYLLTLK